VESHSSAAYYDIGSFLVLHAYGECGQEIFNWTHISEVDLRLSKSTTDRARFLISSASEVVELQFRMFYFSGFNDINDVSARILYFLMTEFKRDRIVLQPKIPPHTR
jgi:hypothetical protein